VIVTPYGMRIIASQQARLKPVASDQSSGTSNSSSSRAK